MNSKKIRTFRSYLFILPALLLFIIFSIYPFIKIFQLSVYSWDGIMPTMNFVGFFNFKDIIFHNPIWWRSIGQAGYITLIALTFQNVLALILALICDRGIKFGQGYRVIFFIPPVLSGIVVGLIWNWIYNGNYGLLNHWLVQLSKWTHISCFANLQRAWLAEPKTALTAVAVINMWKGFGWGFLILLAGLQSIPRQLYEAAKVDGANAWQSFRRITVPLMIPTFGIVSILTILGAMQIYDIIASTTNGGPAYHTEVPITRILSAMQGNLQFGYACAMGLVFGVVLLSVSLIQIRLSRKLNPVAV
ncbi:MAG: sugar ABC transporter permease [Candidatus Omnitrophica bacterium]|nr:sugar ABC transporter permease [Candidatus Omnitrophota bacterium]